MTTLPSPAAGVHELGAYLRQQRQSANLSVRQLSALTGISNPYLSQVERGLRRPSAEILQRLAQGLSVSAESLYVRAGLLDSSHAGRGPDVRSAIRLDGRLGEEQREELLRLYDGFVAAGTAGGGTFDHPNSTLAKEHVMNPEPSEQKEATAKKVVAEALTPVYAVVGASDLAVEKIRELGNRAAQDASSTVDQLQERAEHAGNDVAQVVKDLREDPKAVLKDMRQAPTAALSQAKDAVSTSRKQAGERAEHAGNDVAQVVKDFREDPKGALKDMRQAPSQALNQALGAVALGKKQLAELAERGKDVAEKSRGGQAADQAAATAAGLISQASALVGKGRSKAVHTTEETRRAALKRRDAAVHQVEHVRDQVEHVVADQKDHVREGLTEARRRGSAVVSEGVKPIARRRRAAAKDHPAVQPDDVKAPVSPATPSVAGSGVEAAGTTPVAKRAAKKTAAKRVAKKATAAKPAAKRATAKPADGTSVADAAAFAAPADAPKEESAFGAGVGQDA